MFETGFLTASTKDVAQRVETNLFRHVELDQDENGTLQCFVYGLDGHRRWSRLRRRRGLQSCQKRSLFGFHKFSFLSEGRDEGPESRVKTQVAGVRPDLSIVPEKGRVGQRDGKRLF